MATNSFPISVQFEGPQFKTRGVPIQDLGETLILLQRMVYKAYFIREKQSFKKAVPSTAEKKLLSMEIAGRRRGSDIYQLAWLAKDALDAVAAGALQGISGEIAAALLTLGAGKIWDLIQKKRRSRVDLLAIAIYNELEGLTDRIGKASGINRLEIQFAGRRRPIVIDAKFRDEIKEVKKLLRKGTRQDLIGNVIAPHTIGEDYAFVRVGMDRIKVHLKNKAVFHDMMEILVADPRAHVKFTGKPRLMIDYDPERFVEFYAEAVVSA